MADAQAIIDAAAATPLAAPAYTGAAGDLAYLRTYLSAGASTLYGVEAAVFEQATLLATTLLRDYVSRLVFERAVISYEALPPEATTTAPLDDCAVLIRHAAAGSCGLVSLQLFHAFRAFGWTTTWIDSVNGALHDYGDSHVTTEVFVEDLGRSIVQDAYVNFLLLDADGEVLSWQQAHELHFSGQQVVFRHGRLGLYEYNGIDPGDLLGTDQASILASLLLPAAWVTTALGSTSSAGSAAATWAAGEPVHPDLLHPADEAAARAVLESFIEPGRSWQATTLLLQRAGYDVRGFALKPQDDEPDGWVSFRLADGSAFSFRLASPALEGHAGSYDTLVQQSVLADSTLPADLLAPAVLIGGDGLASAHWSLVSGLLAANRPPVASQSRSIDDGAVRIAVFPGPPVIVTLESLIDIRDADGDRPSWLKIIDPDGADSLRVLLADGTPLAAATPLLLRPEQWGEVSVELTLGLAADRLEVRVADSLEWSEAAHLHPPVRSFADALGGTVVELRDAGARLLESTTTAADGSRLVQRWDVEGSQPWGERREQFDTHTRLVRLELALDDGRLERTRWDAADGAAWASDRKVFDAQGRLESARVIADDGSRWSASYDADGSRPWTQREDTADTAGRPTATRVTNDDGSIWHASFDAAGTRPWLTQERSLAPDGALRTQRTVADDGSAYRIDHDVAGTQAWLSKEQSFDATGRLLASRIVRDDASTYRLNEDVAGRAPWAQQEQLFDAQGRLVSARTVNDDGSVHRASFDPADSASWSQREELHTEAGTLKALKVRGDDGSLYDALHDVLASATWSLKESARDALGRVTSQRTVNDDGSSWRIAHDAAGAYDWASSEAVLDAQQRLVVEARLYDSGVRWLQHHDAAGAQPWQRLERSHAADGRLRAEKVFNDDGTRIERSWDLEGSAAWSWMESVFDADGNLLVRYVTPDPPG